MGLLCSGVAKTDIHIARNQPQKVGCWNSEEEMESGALALLEIVQEVVCFTERLRSQNREDVQFSSWAKL